MKIKLNLTPWLFLAPALIYFTIMVIYPIIGSVHISFHDWNGTQFKCSDGRDIKSLQENEFCRKSESFLGFIKQLTKMSNQKWKRAEDDEYSMEFIPVF